MKNLILLIAILTLSIFSTNAQNTILNEAKYWVWRDRLVNDFMVPGTCTGCGIVFNSRGSNVWNNYPLETGTSWYKGGFDINDEGFQMGKYLIVLASEWRLLFNSGLPTEKTELELYYELKTIDRLDNDAEKYWTQYIDNYPNGTSYPNGIINGFMIRDDVFDNFLWYDTNLPNTSYSIEAYNHYQYLNQGAGGLIGKYQQQNIMKSAYQPNSGLYGSDILSLSQMNYIIRSWDPNCDGYTDNGGFSGAEAGLHATDPHNTNIPLSCIANISPAWLPEQHPLNVTGPEEYSQDNYIGLLQGLVMVNQMVNSNVNVQGLNISGYASTLIDNIIHSIKDNSIGLGNDWLIENPATGKCVKGVVWDKYWDEWPFHSDELCNAGGAQAGWFSGEFAKIHNMYGNGSDINGQWFNGLSTDLLSAILVTLSNSLNNSNKKEREWIDALNDDNETEYQYLDLLYSVLHPDGDINQREFAHYENILNNATCDFSWTSNDANIFTGNLLSEMIIHNLLKLLKGEKYNIIIKDNTHYPIIIEHEEFAGPALPDESNLYTWTTADCNKTITSFNEINSTAVISNFIADGTPLPQYEPQEPCAADVTYTAGKQIHLLPGFKVTNGGKFHGKIEDMGECIAHDGIYNIFNLPYNSTASFLALNNTDSISPQLKSFKTDTVYTDKANKIENIISIYPNPTSGIVYIQYNNDLPFKIEITNVLGENIYVSNFVTNNIGISLTKYEKGIYFLKVFNNIKLIKIDKIVYE